ncbi:hypothetical protein HPB47_022349 [Ixodes persulcatus]|uniref:Uncharacterized protein n=1 Tax=Ixodes persulcatus TaxID=34615 RepID=A0AC60QDA6_IXOPE|nr:hypothetical protein HPB47_022349 [Ixodes persulcatus]
MVDGAGDELALTGQTGGANTTPEAASEQQIMLLQLQLKIAEAVQERQRMELEIQRLQSQRQAESGEVDSSFAVDAKVDEDRRLKFAGLLKGVLAPMPSQEALVPSWFEDVEATLESYEVPREWWAGLVLPRLSLGLPYWMRSTTHPVASSALDYGPDGQALARERLIRTAVWHVPATHDTAGCMRATRST